MESPSLDFEASFCSVSLYAQSCFDSGQKQRIKLRERLIDKARQRYGVLHGEEEAALRDLAKRPRLRTTYISLSHCPQAVAFSFGGRPHGVDIELSSRVTKKLVARVADKKDIERAPSSPHLWVAKECSFKALTEAKREVRVISEIKQILWEKSGTEEAFDFQVASPFLCSGRVWEREGFCIGVAVELELEESP